MNSREEFQGEVSPDRLLSELRALRSKTARKALVRTIPTAWFVENADNIIESPQPELRNQLLALCVQDHRHAAAVVQHLEGRLERPVTDAMVAQALTDFTFRLLSAPRLARYV